MSVFMKRNRFPLVKLPYVRLNYIQSTGTQYIDTEFMPNNNTRVLIEADVPKKQSAPTHVLGVDEWVSGQYFQIRITTSGTTYVNDFGAQAGNNTNVTPNGRMLFDKNKNTLSIEGITVTNTDAVFQCTANLKLLAGVNTAGQHQITSGKIYSCKIYDNDILVRNYIPVRVKDTGATGLWDKVENKFYGNAGTGTFIVGEAAA